MSFSIDDSILANIKTQQDSEDEETGTAVDSGVTADRLGGEEFMEVIGGFGGGNTSDTNVNYEDRIEDPLQDDDDDDEKNMEVKEFPWQCMENDFLRPYMFVEEELDVKVGKNKRAKLELELRGVNGQVWSKVPLAPPIADDLPEFMAAGKGPAKGVTNPLEAWHLLIDVAMLNMVVKSTNEIIKGTKKKEPHQKRLTDLTELRAWLGLNYLCGVLRNSIQPAPVEELWTLELGNAIFRATMSYKRYEFLNQCVRCADQTYSNSGSGSLDEIANFWEKLVINCRSYYAPSSFCMIDEHILDLKQFDNNPFNHHLLTEPGLSGLRLITMCDAKTMYICNSLVANDTQPLDEEVNQLVSDIKGTRRCLCLNERFTNMPLMQKLKQSQLQVVGALPATAKEIPSELLGSAQTPTKCYAKNDCTLVSGLETLVSPTGFLVTNGLSTRINPIKLYENIHLTNRKAYQCMKNFGSSYGQYKNNRWHMEYFYFMLDVAAFNAWTLYRLSENGDAGIEQRDFQRQLGLYLTQQQLKQRIHYNIKLPLPLKVQIAEILGENVDNILNGATKKATDNTKVGSIPKEKALIPNGIVLHSRENDTRRRCRGCKSRNGSKIRTRCQQCLQAYCMRHLITRCETCTGYKLEHSTQDDDTKDEEQPKDETETHSHLDDDEQQMEDADL